MNPLTWPPTAWAVLLALTFVVTARPRPRARTPGCQPVASDRTTRRNVGRRRTPRAVDDPAIALAHWCEAVARTVRSGSSLPTALGETPPPGERDVGAETASVLRQFCGAIVRLGQAPDLGVSSPDAALVVGVVAACVRHGGAAAEPLDRTANVLRGRAAEAAERRVQSAQARLSARLLTVLPVVLLGMLVLTSASTRAAVHTPRGWAVIAVGVGLNLVGWRWQRRLIDRAAT